MSNTTNHTERRIKTRYCAKNGVFAINSKHFGAVEDISLGGLSFNSIDQADWDADKLVGHGILLANNSLFFNKVPFSIVSHSPPDPIDLRSASKTKRYSIKFGNLTEEQTVKLKTFIINYTDGVKG